jgi:hypothetical protein
MLLRVVMSNYVYVGASCDTVGCAGCGIADDGDVGRGRERA